MTRRTVALTTPTHRQAPFAEFVPLTDISKIGRWRIWQHFNNAATAGTYLELSSNGRVDQVTIGPDGNIASTVTILQEL